MQAVDLRDRSAELMNRVREEKQKGVMGRAELAELRQLADKSWKQAEQYSALATEGVLREAEVGGRKEIQSWDLELCPLVSLCHRESFLMSGRLSLQNDAVCSWGSLPCEPN